MTKTTSMAAIKKLVNHDRLKEIFSKDGIRKIHERLRTTEIVKKYFPRTVLKKDYVIGLDIGHASLKRALFRKEEGGLRLKEVRLAEIVRSDNEDENEKKLVDGIKDLFAGIDAAASEIVVAINCEKTFLKKIVVPRMPKAEICEAVRLEAKNHFPFIKEGSMLDCEIVMEVEGSGGKKCEVLVAVSPRETVQQYLDLLKKAGVRPDYFVPVAYALHKLGEHLGGDTEKTKCFIDVGEKFTELVMVKGKDLAFNRKILAAGGDFTKSLTGVLTSETGKTSLSLDEAENIKRKVGFPQENESQVIGKKITASQIISMMRPVLEQFVNEIDRCFNYYREGGKGTEIDGVLVLFGGGASLKGLAKYLSGGLGINARLGDPIGGLKADKKDLKNSESSHLWATVTGSTFTDVKGINLLPPEVKEEARKQMKRFVIQVASVGVILVSMLIFVYLRLQLSHVMRKNAAIKAELVSIQKDLRKAEANQVANMVLINEPYWEDILKELSNLTPANIYFTRINMKDGAITMSGIVASDKGEKILSEFMLTLERGIFKDVKLIGTESIEGSRYNKFEIRCGVDLAAK